MFNIVLSCKVAIMCYYKKKLMMQTWESGKKPNFGHNIGPLKFFSRVLPREFFTVSFTSS